MAVVLMATVGANVAAGAELAFTLRAVPAGPSQAPLTIELFRWSTDDERAPLLSVLSTAPQEPPPASLASGRAGRGGRAGAPPLSPAARLTAAVKAAPTVGFIWGDGPTGYSIKYAWRSASPDGKERVVLVTDRRLGAHSTSRPVASGAAGDAEFTLVEMRIDGKGRGEAKTSLTSLVVIDAAAKTLALDAYADAPVSLEVTR